jgi:hypothetical protein
MVRDEVNKQNSGEVELLCFKTLNSMMCFGRMCWCDTAKKTNNITKRTDTKPKGCQRNIQIAQNTESHELQKPLLRRESNFVVLILTGIDSMVCDPGPHSFEIVVVHHCIGHHTV